MSEAFFVDCCDNSGFSLHLCESTSDGKTRFKGKFQEAEAVNKNKRMYPYSVLDENMKRLQEAVADRRLVGELDHPCLTDSDFEVLTVDGWKHFKELRNGDVVYSRVDGKMVESKINEIIDQPYDGKSFRVKGRSINCEFTAPHKFLLSNRLGDEEYTTINDIYHNRTKFGHHSIPKTATWQSECQKYFVIKSTERSRLDVSQDLHIDCDKFATFLGLYLAEGYIKKSKNSNRIMIAQKNKAGRDLIKNLLTNFHKEIEWKECKEGFYTSEARLYDFLMPLGRKYNKYIPKEVKNMTASQLEHLIAGFAIGDGRMMSSINNSNFSSCKDKLEKATLENVQRISVFTVSEQLAKDLHECIIKTGRAANWSTIITKEDYVYADRVIKANNKRPLYQLEVCKTKNIHLDTRFLKITEENHVGRIYCLTTDHGNFYMKYKGKSFWTGNCDSIIHFADASHVITKLWWEGNSLMGEGEILNTPNGKVLKALINDGVKVGISSRGVGNGSTNEEGILVIGESYKLITFDAVADPSTFSAFQQKIVNVNDNKPKHESVSSSRGRTNEINNSYVKNENTSIHNKVNKEALIACLGGFVKTQTEKIKSGLN